MRKPILAVYDIRIVSGPLGVFRFGGKERLSRTLILAEFGVIVFLFWGMSLEYEANAFFQDWVRKNAWPLGFFLSWPFPPVLLGVLIGILARDIRQFLRREKHG